MMVVCSKTTKIFAPAAQKIPLFTLKNDDCVFKKHIFFAPTARLAKFLHLQAIVPLKKLYFWRRRREKFWGFEHEVPDFPFEITLKSDFFLAAAGGQPPETILAQISQISRSQIFLRRGGFGIFREGGGFGQDLD